MEDLDFSRRPNASGAREAKLALRLAVVTAVSALSLVPAVAGAQNSTTIDGGETSGVSTVNSASGSNNQQANVGLIASGNRAGSAAAVQQTLLESGTTSEAAHTAIAPGAFAGSSGWIAANGASGNDNQQANIAAFSFGIEASQVADIQLSQTRASTEPTGSVPGSAAEPVRTVAIGEGAFENSSGVIQVSLIGGDRNSSANTFALSVSGNAGP